MFPADGTITDQATFKNADNVLYDPITVVLEVRRPDGSLNYPTLTKISTGVYRANILLLRGITRWEWDGITGAVHDRIEGWTCAAEGLTG
jgi:hypothetical protein